MDKDKIFVNTLMEKELVEKLDQAAAQNENTRSGMIRLLVRKGLEIYQTTSAKEANKNVKIKQ